MKHKRLIFILIPLIFFMTRPASAAQSIQTQVPFVSQAPTGNWKDPVFRDACEETSLVMAEAWVMDQSLNPKQVENRLHEVAAWEMQRFGFHQDTSAADTYTMAVEYFHLAANLAYDIGIGDIKQSLSQQNIVIVPIDAGKIYKKGPPRHMVLITGFDSLSNQFIYHDPMKSKGDTRIDADLLQSALRDYPSGIHKNVTENRTAMIAIHWPWLL
jgi:hypothetical protein